MRLMTPTPRTEQFAATPRGLGTGYYQALHFARQLERELAGLRQAMEEIRGLAILSSNKQIAEKALAIAESNLPPA